MTLSDDEIRTALRDMRETGCELDDPDSEYLHGECRLYRFEEATHRFVCRRIDVIVGSYDRTGAVDESEVVEVLHRCADFELKALGFRSFS